MYIRNNIVLNAMFSKYEKQELLAYKMLMEDPESFMSEIYEKLLDKKGEDSYWWIYENHSSPAYHLDPECPLLCSNFKNYRIPASIRFRRITKAKNVESIDDKILTEEEKSVYRRGRNAHSATMAKHATMADYRRATGFEALMGYLYLKEDFSRILELVHAGLEKEEI